MKNFYKMGLTIMMMIFAIAANADVKTLYSWESPEGTVSETGGTIAYVNGEGDRLNYSNGGYYTICLNGKSGNLADAAATVNAGHMVITFVEALKAGDKISVTAYKNKGDATKKACIYMLFKEGVTLVGEDSFNDLLAGTEPSGLEPNTVDYIVPEEADGCTTLTLTRDKNGALTNLFITKLVVTREESASAATFEISDNEDGTIKVTPTPADSKWVAVAFPTSCLDVVMGSFAYPETTADEAFSNIITYGLAENGEGVQTISADWIGEVGGEAVDGEYTVWIKETVGSEYGELITKTVNVTLPAAAEYIEPEMDSFKLTDWGDDDKGYTYESPDYTIQFNLKEGAVIGKQYSIADCYADYTYIKDKNSSDKQYIIQTLNLEFGENNTFTGAFEAKAKDGEVINVKAKYTMPTTVKLTFEGKCEYTQVNQAGDKGYWILAKNSKGDYKVDLSIMEASFANGSYKTDDIEKSYVTIAGNEIEITSADFMSMDEGDGLKFIGELKDASDIIYFITITTNKPSTKLEEVTVDLAGMQIVDDEGDIELVASDGKYKIMLYPEGVTSTNVPDGTYTAFKGYTKFGVRTTGDYANDVVSDLTMEVKNVSGETTVKAMFTQGNTQYTVYATTAEPIVKRMYNMTITDDEGEIKLQATDGAFTLNAWLKNLAPAAPITIPTGVYDLMGYSKVKTGEMDLGGFVYEIQTNISYIYVEKEGNVTTATVTFESSEDGKFYTLIATTADAPVSVDFTITTNESSYTVTPSNNDVDYVVILAPQEYFATVDAVLAGMFPNWGNTTLAKGVQTADYAENAGFMTGAGVYHLIAIPAKYDANEEELVKTGDYKAVTVTLDAEGKIVTDGISNAVVNTSAIGKYLKNGKIVIVKNGKQYNVGGVLVK